MYEILRTWKPMMKLPVLALVFIFIGINGYGQTLNPDFTYSQDCKNFEFTDASTVSGGATITDYLWDFGDGGTSILANPVYTYTSFGTFTVSLKIADNILGLDNTFSISVNIIEPIASFSFTSDCEIFQFNDESTAISGNIEHWFWDFGDGSTQSDVQDPGHSYFFPGSYNVSLTVTHESGCQQSTNMQVSYYSPIVNFSFLAECDSYQFTDESTVSSGNIIGWFWNFGDGTTITDVQNPQHTYSSTGNYNVILTVTHESGCQQSKNHSVSYFIPEAGFNFTSDCETFNFQNTSTPLATIDSVHWHFGEGDTLKLAQPQSFDASYTYSAEGDYTVFMKVFESGCVDTVSHIVSYYIPLAGFTYSQECGLFEFENLSTVYSGEMTYFWDFDDGFSSTEENPEHLFSSSGDYDVTLTVTHESGCEAYYDEVVSFYNPIAIFSRDAACLGLETCFYDESLPVGGIISWSWDFGNGNSSSMQNPCYIYGSPGEFYVTLTVTNAEGCVSVSEEDTLVVDYPPEADFLSNAACFNEVTVFSNQSDTGNVAIASWQWDFGDPGSASNTSALYEPTHLFSAPGNFQVTLSVENINGCTSSIFKPVTVDSIPTALFTTQDTIAAGTLLTIIDNSIAHGSPILIRYWDFGDGTTAINPNPVTHAYSTPGEYEICLIVTNLKNCADTSCQTIVVTALPHANFAYTNNNNLKVNFTDDSFTESEITEWYWNFGDPTVTSDISLVQNPYYIYPYEGFYEVYLKIEDSYNGIHDTLKTIYVGSAVIADFSNVDVCSGDDVVLFDDSYTLVSADYVSWYWNFGDNSDTMYFQQTDSIIHHYDIPGIYDVTFITAGMWNGALSFDTIVKQVSVYNQPIAWIDSLHLVACLHQPINFVDSSYSIDGDTISAWYWEFGDGASSTLQNPSYNGYDSISDYQVFLTITTIHGCQSRDTITAKITIAPDIDFKIENACINSPAYFIHSESDIEITDWYWNFNDQHNPGVDTSSLENPTYVYTHIAEYNVTMIASSYGCAKTVDKSFIVYPIPYTDFTVSPNYTGVQGRTLFTNNSIYATSYLWDFGNGHTSNVMDPIEVYEFDSTYTITLISFNEYGCSDTSRSDLNVFFRGLYFPTAFSPNHPNEEIARFMPKGVNLADYHVMVFDLKGSLMWESDELDEYGSPAESWDGYCNGLLMPEGMYIWKAEGIFRDGLVWKGSDLQNINPQTNGTVTLIR
jgi:PKD repeat protein